MTKSLVGGLATRVGIHQVRRGGHAAPATSGVLHQFLCFSNDLVILHPGMFQCLHCREALLRVKDQQLLDEINGIIRDILPELWGEGVMPLADLVMK